MYLTSIITSKLYVKSAILYVKTPDTQHPTNMSNLRYFMPKSLIHCNKKGSNKSHFLFYGGLKPALLELSIKDFIIELAKPEVIELIKCIDRFNLAA